MQRLFAILVVLMSSVGAAVAYDEPKALLDAIYAPYIDGRQVPPPDTYYSARLKTLLAANIAKQAVDHTGQRIEPEAADSVNFDPFIEGQHSLLLDVAIAAPVITGDHAIATVSFHNFDHASLLTIAMVKDKDGWKVDDVASLGSGENWLLSWLLQYDPFSVN